MFRFPSVTSDSSRLGPNENNYCIWRPTLWDKKVFGLTTAEILYINYDNALPELLDLINARCEEAKIDFLYLRHDANDQQFKKMAVCRGFYITEMSIFAYHQDISRVVLQAKTDLEIREICHHDQALLREIGLIARDAFHHGRFHEDPVLDPLKVRQRYQQWMPDLAKSSKICYFMHGGEPGGFFAYSQDDDWLQIDLVALSSQLQGSGLGRTFWISMLNHIWQWEGIPRLRTQISAANYRAMTFYANLGFSFTGPRFGYHKLYHWVNKYE